MVDYFRFLIYRFFKFIVLLLPKFLIKGLLDVVVKVLYFISKRHREKAKANIDLVYQNTIAESKKIEIIKNSYKSLVYNIYEFIENQTLSLKEFENKITVQNEEYILNAIKNKRKIILITAHYGNWEYGNTFIPLKYAPTTMVGRPLNNIYLNKELDLTRTKNNNEMLTKSEASRGLVKALKNNRMLGLVIDQHNKTGIDVDFLGHKVKQTDSSSRLAIKFDALIIPVFFTMTSFGKYDAKFYEPIEPSSFEGEHQIYDLTQAQADVMSKHILKQPEQWLWQHKRFKKYHKNIYK